MAQRPPSCRRLYQTSRRHPRTYILTFSNSSPRDTHLRIFSRLSNSSLAIAFILPLPTSTVTPTPTPPSDPLIALPTLRFFPPLYRHFNIFLKRWSLTSNVTPTPTSNPNSPPRLTYPAIFSRLSNSIFTFLKAVEPNLQRHPYTNIGSALSSSPYLPYHFSPTLPPFLLLLKRWSLTSNVTPTPTSDSDSPPRVTNPTIFSQLSTSILTFLEAVEPYLQRHPHAIIRFGFASSPYPP